MSNPVGAQRYGLGGGDAYYDAVKYGGYEGTREQFGRDQAQFAQNAAAVAEAKEVIEQDTEEVRSTRDTFVNTTVPDAIAAIQQEGADQVQAVEQQGEESSQQVEAVGTQWKDAVANEGRSRVQAITETGAAQIQAIQEAGEVEIDEINDLKESLETATENANTAKNQLNQSISNAATTKTQLDQSISNASASKTQLDQSIQDAGTAKSQLDQTIEDASTIKTQLQEVIDTGMDLKDDLEDKNDTASQNIRDLTNKNAEATTKEAALRAALADGDEILTGVEDIKAYIGYPDEDIVGVQVDYTNKTYKRLAGAYGFTPGSDFDAYSMFGGRRRCNVADDGTINAYYGDANYVEDGSNGQVMVYQPKFYYKVVPLVLEEQTDGVGYHLRKANYYVSATAKEGFKLHPAFYDKNGDPVDYILISAYEGCLYDTSAGDYITDDNQVGDFTATTGDKLSSIAGVKPASGNTQALTRPNIEVTAQNRGSNWHGYTIKIASMNQMLMLIEIAGNLQTAVGQGVVSISDSPNITNNSSLTGSTSSLGNGTGRAAQTINERDGTTYTETADGKTAVSYRGMENPWGNIWDFVYGINIYGNGSQKGGIPYICSDFSFAESRNSGNYESAGFTVTNANGYISAFGYSEDFDWLFIASETSGNSALPVGDYIYITANLNGYRVTLLGGGWFNALVAGGFFWLLSSGVGYRVRYLGGRLVYVPEAV